MQFGSYLASFLLHATLLLAALLWPSSPPLKLNQTVYQVSLVDGAPGGDMLPSAVMGPKSSGPPVKAEQKPTPEALAPEAPTPPPPTPSAQPLDARTQPDPLKSASAVPRPESVPKPAPRPEPARDAVALSEKKVETKPEEPQPEPKSDPKKPIKPEPKAESKPEPKAESKPEPKAAQAPAASKPTTEPKDKDDNPAPSREDALKAALADARKQAKPQSGGRQSALSGALADLQRSADQNIGGGGGEGDGPGGGGINDVYAGLVILAVRPNWSMPTYSRENLAAVVRIKLDAQGNVLDCQLERSSGRPDFDGSTVNAVIRTKVLPAPPTPEQQELLLTFNSQEMMGR